MKTRIYLLAALFCLPIFSKAQKKVTEKDIIGTWKMIITISDKDDDDDDEDIEDREVDESFLGHVIASSVTAFVENILDGINVEFVFRKDGRLDIYAMGERDDDDNEWFINSDGQLIIKDRDDRDRGYDDVWMLKDGKLVAYEIRGTRLKEKEVYLERVDK